MRKALTVAIIAVMLFGSLALLPAPTAHAAETILNELIGNLVVFHQNYSTQGITDNIFAADNIVRTHVANYTLTYNNEKKAVEFYSWTGNTYYLFIGGLYPAVQTSYTLDFSIERDYQVSYVEILTATMWLGVRLYDNNTYQIMIYHYADNGTLSHDDVYIAYNNHIPLHITWNGVNKTAHIQVLNNATVNIWTAATYADVRNLPYAELSGTFIMIKNTISSSGTYLKTYLYELKQTIPRYTITAVPRNNLQPFGFDGPHDWDTVQKGFAYLDKYGYRATLWLDVTFEWRTNATVKKYLQDYVNNKSWEVGIHYSKKLNTLTLAAAEENMTAEYNTVKNDFGQAPLSWCSLTNADNVTHVNYAYTNLNGMIWRNDRGGIKGLTNIGNLDNTIWYFWDTASQHGFIHPTFTHETDVEPAIDFSIDWSKFTTWVDRYHEHGIQIVPFAEYYYINANQHDFYATNIERGDGYLKFTAHTNGYKAWVDVTYTPTSTTVVKDLTTGKLISWESGSVQFWVEDGHTYEIIDTMKQAINISIDWTYALVGTMISLMAITVMMNFLGDFMQGIRKAMRFGHRK